MPRTSEEWLWVLIGGILFVGAAWGFGLFLGAMGRAIRDIWWDISDAYLNWKDRREHRGR